MTKPDDKTCIIKAVEAVWGDKTPDKYHYPEYYEQFMDVTSKAIVIDDWVFVKRIQYKLNNQKRTVGFGLFKKVLAL
jgi:hypothetical protein